jgi:heme exporter protein A
MHDSRLAIHAHDLSKRFGNRTVLNQIHLAVIEGDVVAMVGANGAGKTTLLRCLAGSARPTSGEVRWFGRSVRDPAARRLIGVVAHESLLYPNLTLQENLAFAARMYGVHRPMEQAERWLADLGLSSHADRQPREVSRGMRGRVAVARALVHDPPILLLDEPFSGLDTQWAEWLCELVEDLRGRGKTICLATHDWEKARALAQRVLLLQGGRAEDLDLDTRGVARPLIRARAA